MFTINLEDGREAPSKASLLNFCSHKYFKIFNFCKNCLFNYFIIHWLNLSARRRTIWRLKKKLLHIFPILRLCILNTENTRTNSDYYGIHIYTFKELLWKDNYLRGSRIFLYCLWEVKWTQDGCHSLPWDPFSHKKLMKYSGQRKLLCELSKLYALILLSY